MTTGIFNVYEKSGKIYLLGIDENKKRVIIEDENTFAPYHGEFYIRSDSESILEEFDDIIDYNISPSEKKSLFGESVLKIRYIIINFDRVSELREKIEMYRNVIYEGDLWGRMIYCLDKLPSKGYSLEGDWRKCVMDIETTSQFGFPDSNDPKEDVLCSTFYDSYTQKYHFFYWGGEKLSDRDDIIIHYSPTEKEMLDRILEWLIEMKFFVIMGWNISFDTSYLFQRFLKVSDNTYLLNQLSPLGKYVYNSKYKSFSIWGLLIFDLLESYKRIVRNELSSFKLDDVAFEELGEKKIEVNIKELNIMTKEKLLEYNKKDVYLCIQIDNKVNIFNFFDGLRQFVGLDFDGTRFSRSLIDFMLLKKARSMNVVLPTAQNGKKGKRNFEGAYVDAVQGSYKNVIAFDIAGLYPNIIKTFNLSPECIRQEESDIKLPELNISIEKEGIIPSIVNDLMVLRRQYDTERDKYPAGHPLHEKNDILVESAKLIVDAIYGITAFPGFRLFESKIASSITYCGREIITHTKEFIENRGHKVVVTDTDSSYFISSKTEFEDVVNEGKLVLELVNIEYKRWVKEKWGISNDKCYLKNVFKKVYKRLIVGAKKRYCGHVVWAKGILSNKIELVGVECKRSDYSRFARDFQFELIKLLLNDVEDKIVLEFIQEKLKNIKSSLPTLIAIPTKIEKSLEEYKTNLPKVRGSKYCSDILNERFDEGDKPLLLFTEGESDIILFYNDKQAEILLKRVRIDWHKMIERDILYPSQLLLLSDNRGEIYSTIKLIDTNQKTLFNF